MKMGEDEISKKTILNQHISWYSYAHRQGVHRNSAAMETDAFKA
jgi:hypothetical protein